MYNINLIAGDFLGEGHGETIMQTIESSLSPKEFTSAMIEANKIFNVMAVGDLRSGQLNASELFGLRKLGYDIKKMQWWSKEKQWVRRGKSPRKNPYILVEEYIEAILCGILKVRPDFEYKFIDNDNVIEIGGYGLLR